LIRTSDAKAKVGQHFADAGHANAADANEVNVLEGSEHEIQ
jgi:hypothetical protein